MTPSQDRLLVVDDDVNYREMLSRRLMRQGFQVEVAEGGSEALEKIRQAHYDLVLLDQMMPGTGGLDLLRLLRAIYSPSDLPVIMVTADSKSENAVEALEGGANDYVTKPVDMPVVTARIEAQLSRSKADREIRAKDQREVMAAHSADRGTWDWDLVSNQIHISPGWVERIGLPDHEISGSDVAQWPVHPGDLSRVRDELATCLESGAGELRIEARVSGSDGQWRRLLAWGSISRLEDGTPVRLAGSIADTSPLHVSDPLTGLGNRQVLLEKVATVPALSPFALLLLDLDGFKLTNESFGHEAGDGILLEVAARLQNAVAELDLSQAASISRISGDEFTVLLEGAAATGQAGKLAEAILSSVTRPIRIDRFQLSISASLGVVVEGGSHSKAHDVLHDAILAMYHARELGKNRWQMFEPARRDVAYARMAMVNDLRYAAEQDQLLSVYQPKIDLQTRKIVGFEALMRWRHPERGLLMPVDFIPLAEETGLIVCMGEWILKDACRQLKTWQTRFPASPCLSMNVNLSVRQLSDPNLVESVRRILDETAIASGSLKLELTESTLMTNMVSARGVLDQLQAMHVGLKLDDFGTGYSSLNYLRALRFDSLKIDRSFIVKLTVDLETRAIVDTIIKLAHTLDMTVVAEGIEDAEQADELSRMGCDLGQGYYFSRPVEADAAERLLMQRDLCPSAA